MANFGWTATSLFEIWTPAWSFVKSLLQRKFFFSLQNGTLSFFFGPVFSFFFFFFFFYRGLFSALDFSVSKDFSISKELLRVNLNKNRAST